MRAGLRPRPLAFGLGLGPKDRGRTGEETMRRLLIGLAVAAALVTLVQPAAARNPAGRNYGGAIFSAGVSGRDEARKTAHAPLTLTQALAALTQVSDDT